ENVTQKALNTYEQLLKQVNFKSISALANMDDNG
ncbi:MarR family transcriptional regulator, partial [Mesorhizobium sp. M8A.F.Ca.ET.173.01.1.1]